MFKFLIYSIVAAFIIYILRKYFNGPKTNLEKSMIGKTIIVTGSNSGIGKTTAVELVKKGAKVVFANRDEEKTLAVINSIKDPEIRKNAYFIKLDLGSFESILNFTKEFKNNFLKVDILINNAGATFDTFGKRENIERTTMVNHIGPVCLTTLLLESINPKGKIINVSSRGHKRVGQTELDYLYKTEDFSHMQSDYMHMGLYCISKIGNVYHSKYLADYFNRNRIQIKTASLHPGLVNTEIFDVSRMTTIPKKMIMFLGAPLLWLISKDPLMGAQTTLHVAYMDYEELNSGAYFNHCHEEKQKEIACNSEKIKEFMNFTKDQILKNWSNTPKEISEYLN